ncbi:MAG: glycosyltransferase family 2 protein [Anaerolineales bacterium]|nr:glycosyltransferase family 2 protein [Anaerolineales bacterium]
MNCSVVIPVYYGEATLEPLVERLGKVLSEQFKEYEVILVNDGSPDQSWEKIETLKQRFPFIVGINLIRNYGQHNATLCGIRAAKYDLTITMDDDLQQTPEEIPLLVAKLSEGYDVVYGTPKKASQSLWRRLGSQITRLALRSVMGNRIAQVVSPYRAFRTSIRDAFANYASPSVSIDVLLTWGANRYADVTVHHNPRHSGASTYTFRKLVRHALDMMTGFSTLPLRLASGVGFFFTLFGVGILIYVVGRYLLLGYSVPGFPFLASVISIFAGATLFALGIMGEYLARIYERSMEKPAYVVQTVLEHKTELNSNAT